MSSGPRLKAIAHLLLAGALCAPAAAQDTVKRDVAAELRAERPNAAVIAQAPVEARGDDAGRLPTPEELAAVEIDPNLDDCLQRLDAPSYAERERAMAELFSDAFANEQLYAVLLRRDLNAEQRHRVLQVVRERLLTMPRGAVGIKVDQRAIPDKIIIEELLPDLPARHVLEKGDEITHLHGRPLESWQEFVEEVQSRLPGEKVTLTVERIVSGGRPNRLVAAQEPKYETLEIEIELGSAELLRDPVTGRAQRGGSVWQRRKREADLALQEFGPKPRRLRVEG